MAGRVAKPLPRVAVDPRYQPIVDRFRAFLTEKGWGIMEFCEAVYGRDHRGAVRGGGGVYPLVTGAEGVGAGRAELFRDKVGLDLTDLVTPYSGTRAADAVDAYHAAVPARAPAPPPPPPPPRINGAAPRFAVSLDNHGTGNLTFNLTSAPAAEVLRAFAVLQAAGLVEPERQAEPVTESTGGLNQIVDV